MLQSGEWEGNQSPSPQPPSTIEEGWLGAARLDNTVSAVQRMVPQAGGKSWAGCEQRRHGQGTQVDRCPVSPPHPRAATRPWVLTLWKSRETLLVNARAAMSQWILKTLYLPEEKWVGRASLRSVSEVLRGEVGKDGLGKRLYVFLQSTDTQKMPAARKQADMIR